MLFIFNLQRNADECIAKQVAQYTLHSATCLPEYEKKEASFTENFAK